VTFVKLDCDIVKSSVWAEDSDVLRVWVYFLATANATGEVRVTVPALAMQCGLPADRAQAILDKFASPDPFSRSQEHEGRRIRIERDPEFKIVVLNYGRYRAKDHTNAERQQRFRDKHEHTPASVTPLRNAKVTPRNASQKSEVRSQKSQRRRTEDSCSTRGVEQGLYPDDFLAFWKTYPRKTGKGKALTAWKKIKPPHPTPETILVSIEAHMASSQWTKENGDFIPYPASWLNARGWEDELSTREGRRSQSGLPLPPLKGV
jgi:hypothetical protein